MAMKRVVSLILGLAMLAVVLGGVHLFSKSRTTQLFGEIIPRVGTPKPVVALTFDDGPSVRFTPEVLAILRERGIKATFFLTGKETEENLPQARMIVSDGHQVGNHSYTHSNMAFMGLGRVGDEIERTDAAIRTAGHKGEIMFRPPYGKKLFALRYIFPGMSGKQSCGMLSRNPIQISPRMQRLLRSTLSSTRKTARSSSCMSCIAAARLHGRPCR